MPHRKVYFCVLVLLTVMADQAAAQTVASSICTNLQTFYRSDSHAEFFVCGQSDGGVAAFEGPTTNNAPPNGANFSDASWTSGRVAVGKFGGAQFRTSSVDATHRNYYLAVVQTGTSLPSQLSARVYGRDGLSRPIFIGPVSIPDPSGSFPRTSEVQLFAPVGPVDGASSLELSVLRNFVAHDLTSALEDLEARVLDLKEHHHELVHDSIKEAALITAIETALHLARVAAGRVGYEFLKASIPLVGQAHLLVDLSKSIFEIYYEDILLANVVQAQERLARTLAAEETLALKTFLPERIEVTGLSTGGGNVVIGGAGERYRNDFQNLDGGRTTGTSRVFNSGGVQIAAGAINTQNFFDSTRNAIYAESNISLTNGSRLSRKGFVLSPFVSHPDGSITSPRVRFEFFAAPAEDVNAPFGSFNQGLNGFSTTGNVSLTTTGDGRTAALLTESSPSSITTIVNIPPDAAILICDYRWTKSFTPHENAIFSADFSSDGSTTQLILSSADDEAAHADSLQRQTVSIPQSLRGKHGVIRFLLTPSESDGIMSEVMMGGFDVVPQTNTEPPSTSISIAGPAGNSGWYRGEVQVTLTAVDPEGSAVTTFYKLDGGAIRTYSGPFGIAGDGAHMLTFWSIDDAGNEELPQGPQAIRIDATPPTVVCTVSPNSLWPPNKKMIPVNVSVTVSDFLSGPAGFILVSAVSNEPVPGGAIENFISGTTSTAGLLRADRAGGKGGRVYTLTYKGSDVAGNMAVCSGTVLVPHDQGDHH
jgi:hypothetical protein